MADRIQARAIRRCGELLKQFDGSTRNPANKGNEGALITQRQADDDTLRKMADRIQARAIRRCGELLKQFDGRGEHRKAAGALPSSRDMAREAGMSEHQHKQAVRVANVPADVFERETESETPPTVTKLAQMGTQKRAPQPFRSRTPGPPPFSGMNWTPAEPADHLTRRKQVSGLRNGFIPCTH